MSCPRPRILFVDDEPEIVSSYARALGSSAECLVAMNFEQMKEQADLAEGFVLDYSVGRTRFEDLVSLMRDRPALLVTGFLEPLMDRQLTKPFVFPQLIAAIADLMHEICTPSTLHEYKRGDRVDCLPRSSFGAGRVRRRISTTAYYEIEFDFGTTLIAHSSSLERRAQAHAVL